VRVGGIGEGGTWGGGGSGRRNTFDRSCLEVVQASRCPFGPLPGCLSHSRPLRERNLLEDQAGVTRGALTIPADDAGRVGVVFYPNRRDEWMSASERI
jgi:hypothetical protein